MDSNHNSAIIIHATYVRIAAGLKIGMFIFFLLYRQPGKAGVPLPEQLQKTNSLRVIYWVNATPWNAAVIGRRR